jgi:hypothetical protein
MPASQKRRPARNSAAAIALETSIQLPLTSSVSRKEAATPKGRRSAKTQANKMGRGP